jgi:hypothetical protein
MTIVHTNTGFKPGKLLIYENNSVIVEIDSRGIRKLSKYDNEIINNPEIITIIEEEKQVTISVNGKEFCQLENYKKTNHDS